VKEGTEQIEELLATVGHHRIEPPQDGEVPFQPSNQLAGSIEDFGGVEVEAERTLDSQQRLAAAIQDMDGERSVCFEKEASEDGSGFLDGVEQFVPAFVGDHVLVEAFEATEDLSPLLLLADR